LTRKQFKTFLQLTERMGKVAPMCPKSKRIMHFHCSQLNLPNLPELLFGSGPWLLATDRGFKLTRLPIN
jgi:hypothetical protein